MNKYLVLMPTDKGGFTPQIWHGPQTDGQGKSKLVGLKHFKILPEHENLSLDELIALDCYKVD